jgi:hypothetical protein
MKARLKIFYLLCFTLTYDISTCFSQKTDKKGSPLETISDRLIPPQPGCTIQLIETTEKPFAGYSFYDSLGIQRNTVNIRLFPNHNPLQDQEFIREKQEFIQITEDTEQDTLNAIIRYKLTSMPAAQKDHMRRKLAGDIALADIFPKVDFIVSYPNNTSLSGSRHQFVLVQSNLDFVKTDSCLFSQTYVSIYSCEGIVVQRLVLNQHVNKMSISDDGLYLLAECVQYYYGEEETEKFTSLLLLDLTTNQNKKARPLIDQEIVVDDMIYNSGYFQISFNRDSPVGWVHRMLISPDTEKVYQGQFVFKYGQPDDIHPDLKKFWASNL